MPCDPPRIAPGRGPRLSHEEEDDDYLVEESCERDEYILVREELVFEELC